ncbi:MAG TPA: VanW family protein [Candidatus Limnocylindrales bacterium]
MTDLPDPAADETAAAPTAHNSAPASGQEAAGDPELAALVRRGNATPAGDPELAALVARAPATVPQAAAPGQPVVAAPAAAEAPAAVPEAAPLVMPSVASGAADPLAGQPVASPTAPVEADTPTLAAGPSPAGAAVAPVAADAPTAALPAGGPAPEAEFPVAAVAATPSPDAAPRSSHRRRSLFLRFAFAFVLGVVLVGAIGAGGLYAWGLQYDGRVLPGVRLGNLDLSGLTRDQAQAAITKALGSLGSGSVVLNGPDGKTTLAFGDLGRGPDVPGLLDAALGAGRRGEPFADLIGGPQAALHGVTLGPAVTYDRAKLVAAVDKLAASIDQPASDASVSLGTAGAYSVTAAKDGRAVDKATLLKALDQQLSSLDAPAQITLDVPVATVLPAVATIAADTAKAEADRMAADLVLARGSDTWTIPSASLQPLIGFTVGQDGSITPTFNADGLDPLVKQLGKQVNQSVQDATLRLVGNHVVAGGTSREGRTLDVAGTKAAIVSQMAARQAGTAVEPLAIVVKAVQPKLSSAQATAYAAQMVPVGQYSIYYWVIINNHWGGNIEGPANKINGTVIPAGGIFDFWNVVGDLHQIPGVGPGNAIEGGKITVTGAFGGGICTTSTTLFNAAIHAGMIPLARQNHNEFIDRYPPGLDATVWIVGNAKQTMSFKNDTAYPILIQRVITYAGSKRWLTFKIWSVPNGRTLKLTNQVIQPGAVAIDTVENDPTHPKGWSYRVNAPVNGAQVWVTVNIYDHGKLHFQKRYYSNYPPVNGVLQVGTG